MPYILAVPYVFYLLRTLHLCCCCFAAAPDAHLLLLLRTLAALTTGTASFTQSETHVGRFALAAPCPGLDFDSYLNGR